MNERGSWRQGLAVVLAFVVLVLSAACVTATAHAAAPGATPPAQSAVIAAAPGAVGEAGSVVRTAGSSPCAPQGDAESDSQRAPSSTAPGPQDLHPAVWRLVLVTPPVATGGGYPSAAPLPPRTTFTQLSVLRQ